jgi:hypothetical protein
VIAAAVLIASLSLGAASGSEDVVLSPRNASYDMDVRLEEDAHLLHGEQVLHWRNDTPHSTSELRYHLYYNAWRNDRASFLRQIDGRSDRDAGNVRDDEWAYCDVHTIELVDEDGDVLADLGSGREFISPDDDNPDDRTVLRVPLSQPVDPGQTVHVKLTWTSKVPRTFARTGVRGDYWFLAQWFPKVGVLEADGSWNCHQFIQTEFYADFGVYDVRLRVPTGWIVGATGREVESVDHGDGTTTHRHVQADVHDFAWTTAPDTIVHEQRFEHEGLPPVDMRLLLRPEHAGMEQRYFSATEAALQYYGTWWGAYPYGHITIVDPAYGSHSGGMEYPTLFTGGTRWVSPRLGRSPEGVTVHEAGHQFWYGIVANNEFEHAWLDEGFNTYSTTRTMQQAFPEHALVERYFEGFLAVAFDGIVPVERTDGADHLGGSAMQLELDPQQQLSYRTGPGGYRVNAYDKGALTLRTLENHLGWPTFQEVMSTYFSRWRFRHPTPQDFFATAEEVSGVELDWFFDQVWAQSIVFDYAVGEVEAARARAPRGWIDGEQGLELGAGEEDTQEQWRSEIVVRRKGEGVYPVLVDVEFEDGSRTVEQWDGRDRWVRYAYDRSSRVTRVVVDPARDLVLDIDRTNNSWLHRSRAREAATKWASKWMLWVQASMEAFAFFS